MNENYIKKQVDSIKSHSDRIIKQIEKGRKDRKTMQQELETYKERLTRWIENGYKPEGEIPKAEFVNPEGSIFIEHHHKTGYTSEPTIKVSELREWCLHHHFVSSRACFDVEYAKGYCNAIKQILDQFCNEGK